MALLECDGCQRPAEKPDDVKSYVCGYCVQFGVAQAEAKRKERLAKYDPDKCRALRKEEGYTQKQLSSILGLPTTTVGRFEREDILPPRALTEWMDSRI